MQRFYKLRDSACAVEGYGLKAATVSTYIEDHSQEHIEGKTIGLLVYSKSEESELFRVSVH